MLRSDFCDFSDAYIVVVRGTITLRKPVRRNFIDVRNRLHYLSIA